MTNNIASSGGGIALGPGSSLTLSSSTISDNTATATGFLQGGGGIHLDRVRATVSASTVSGNTAVGDGGGIHNESSSLTISTSDLSGNTARLGGGVYVSGTATTVSSSTVAANTAVVGGGVYNTGGFVTVSTSTITFNTATGNTTFIGRGGGIYNGGTSSSVLASTISGNTAAVGGGGGIYDALDALSIGQGHRVSGTIITDGCNAASSRPPVIDGGYNVDTGSTCVNPAAPATGSRFNTPAGLDPAGLAANGGPTRTIALVAASAAIGLIPNGTVGSCPRTDQRGTASVAGAPCDAGAFQTVSVVCAAGSYSATGSSPCTPAAPGFFVASAGATLATPCPLGAFQDQAGQSSCIPAPIGFYVSQVAAVAATACPPGTTTSVDGATSMGSCVAVAVVPPPDSVPPSLTGLVTPAANAAGWNNTTVIVDWTAVDPAPSSGPASDPPDTTVSTEGANQTITSEESCDASGNCATGTVTVSIDVTAPMLTIGAPTEVVLGDTINITCAATDALSGIVTGCVGVSEPAAAVGPWVFTFTGTDRAGNQTTETVTVSVLAPANTAPVVNADMGVPGLQEIGFRTGAVVVLGSFTDAENNGPYTATMRWSAGGSFTRTVLVGNGRITAGWVYFGSVSRTATLRICDAAGLCGTDDITIRPNVTVRVAPRVCVVDRANLVAPRYEARWGFTNPASYAIAVGSLPQHRHSEDQLPPLHLTPAATAPIVDGKTSVGHTDSRVHPPGSIERPLELERQAVVSPR